MRSSTRCLRRAAPTVDPSSVQIILDTGLPTARDPALDGDVILAAQAQARQAEEPTETVVVATTNGAHLERYVDARLRSAI